MNRTTFSLTCSGDVNDRDRPKLILDLCRVEFGRTSRALDDNVKMDLKRNRVWNEVAQHKVRRRVRVSR
jgi:hypothetical protein